MTNTPSSHNVRLPPPNRAYSSNLPSEKSNMFQTDPTGRKTALLTGTVRDGGRKFSKNLRNLIRVLECRFELEVFIVESDSTDSTATQLTRLSKEDARITFASLGNLTAAIPGRLERIAHCRNIYLDFLDQAGDSFEFVVIADLDGVNSGLGKRQIAELDLDGNWAACFANQAGPYYDIGALRANNWQEKDPFESRQKLVEDGFGFEEANQISVTSKMVVIPRQTPPIEVESAFGGFAVYRAEWIRGRRYSATPEGESSLQVEHVSLNRSIRQNGGKLFIIPGMTNARFTEHTSNLRWISKFSFWLFGPFFPFIKKLIGEKLSQTLGVCVRNFFRS